MMESHQRKGLASAVVAALCLSIQQKSTSIIFSGVLEGSHGRVLAEKLGFVSDDEFCYTETGNSNRLLINLGTIERYDTFRIAS